MAIATARPKRKPSRLGALIFLTLLAVIVLPTAAQAHDPLFLEAQHDEPEHGPLLPDARISFALYGTLLAPQDQRGFQFEIPPGGRLNLSLLIPDLEPENALPRESLPSLALTRPNQTVLVLEPSIREQFAEPYSRTNYVRLLDHSEVGSEGTYQVRITGARPSRFTVSVGYIEAFGTPVGNMANRNSGTGTLTQWYTTPPPDKSAIEPLVVAQRKSTIETVPSSTTSSTASTVSSEETRDGDRNPLLVAGGLVVLVAIALIPLVRLK